MIVKNICCGRLGEIIDLGPAGAADEVVEMLRGNLNKIAEHGKRADGIVIDPLLGPSG